MTGANPRAHSSPARKEHVVRNLYMQAAGVASGGSRIEIEAVYYRHLHAFFRKKISDSGTGKAAADYERIGLHGIPAKFAGRAPIPDHS